MSLTLSSSQESFTSIRNRLLTALPRDDYERLLPNLESVRLPRNRILYEAGEAVPLYSARTTQPLGFAPFPCPSPSWEREEQAVLTSGMASFLTITEGGQTIDICMVGNEGFIGDDLIAKVAITPCLVMTRFPCGPLRVEADALLEEFNRGGKLHEALLLYSWVLEIEIAQAVVCNLFHDVRRIVMRRLGAFDVS